MSPAAKKPAAKKPAAKKTSTRKRAPRKPAAKPETATPETQATTAPDAPAPDAPPPVQDVKPGKQVKIERETRGAWWCPICDHSNTQLTPTCGGCGANRDGDAVKAAG